MPHYKKADNGHTPLLSAVLDMSRLDLYTSDGPGATDCIADVARSGGNEGMRNMRKLSCKAKALNEMGAACVAMETSSRTTFLYKEKRCPSAARPAFYSTLDVGQGRAFLRLGRDAVDGPLNPGFSLCLSSSLSLSLSFCLCLGCSLHFCFNLHLSFSIRLFRSRARSLRCAAVLVC